MNAELAKAIRYVKTHFGHNDYETVLSIHARGYVWRQPEFRAFNGLPIDQLRELLGQNIEVQDEPSVPKCETEGDLSPEDYESMIDFALITGDKEWFNELVTKSKYEGAIS